MPDSSSPKKRNGNASQNQRSALWVRSRLHFCRTHHAKSAANDPGVSRIRTIANQLLNLGGNVEARMDMERIDMEILEPIVVIPPCRSAKAEIDNSLVPAEHLFTAVHPERAFLRRAPEYARCLVYTTAPQSGFDEPTRN
jgi:hypothetical protein